MDTLFSYLIRKRKTRVTLVHLLMRRDFITLMINPANLPRKAASLTNQHGKRLAMATTRPKVRTCHTVTPPDRPRVSRDKEQRYFRPVSNIKSCTLCCQACTRGLGPVIVKPIEGVKGVFCTSVQFCPDCHKWPSCCSRSTCRVQIAPSLGSKGS